MIEYRDINVGHIFCGLGGGARGFNRGRARLGNLVARFHCVGGIDSDAAGLRDFEKLSGVPGTQLDLFSREQYVAFHGHEPPAEWREATPADVRRAFLARPHIGFLSAPCKGFSGLLSEMLSKGAKYQALNGLTLRGVWLLLEAFADDPVELILFENVPRIATRGRHLLDQIVALFRAYNYLVAETTHDCGELGNLAQSRKRFLLVARHAGKVPNFLYEPSKRPLRGVGEVLDRLPLPLSGEGGPMHRVPSLQWKTWVRLAFVRAGSDWRSLNDLTVVDGVLRDFGILPERGYFNGAYGVNRWAYPSGVVTSNGLPSGGSHAVADPRVVAEYNGGVLGVRRWEDTAGVIPARSYPNCGAHSIADPRTGFGPNTHHHVLKVGCYDRHGGTVTASHHPAGGALSVADPRVDGHPKSVQLGVRPWNKAAGVVTGKMIAGGGPHSVADPRFAETRFNNCFRIVRFDETSPAVAGPGGAAGGLGVADPRMQWHASASSSKVRVTPYDGASRLVTGAQQVASGAQAVADPRPPLRDGYKVTKYRVTGRDEAAGAVIGASTTGNGAFAVADPRWRDGRAAYLSGGHYGVLPFDATSLAVMGAGQHDNGPWSVADPRQSPTCAMSQTEPDACLPAAAAQLVCVIRALDGTWHRPFTTLELAALQSLVDPDEIMVGPQTYWDLDGMSDSAKRERIGNAVPSDSAAEMAGAFGRCLLAAWSGTTFTLASEPIWVRPPVLALAAAQGGFE